MISRLVPGDAEIKNRNRPVDATRVPQVRQALEPEQKKEPGKQTSPVERIHLPGS
ncbi:MAG: hypothetical protein IKT07_10680 [Oscillospiraceae bacterium]|nr:hypothetical protein [Oscillospiraceae bacterium]